MKVHFETTGRTYQESVSHPSNFEAAGLVEPTLGSVRRAVLGLFHALDIDGSGLHDTRFRVDVELGKDKSKVSVTAVK